MAFLVGSEHINLPDREYIKKVYVSDTQELVLSLESEGQWLYQFVYRAACGVYWDNEIHGFKSTPIRDWSCAQWFGQVVSAVKSELGIQLCLSCNTVWHNIPEKDKNEIERKHAI